MIPLKQRLLINTYKAFIRNVWQYQEFHSKGPVVFLSFLIGSMILIIVFVLWIAIDMQGMRLVYDFGIAIGIGILAFCVGYPIFKLISYLGQDS